jgi:hypothetical protein
MNIDNLEEVLRHALTLIEKEFSADAINPVRTPSYMDDLDALRNVIEEVINYDH